MQESDYIQLTLQIHRSQPHLGVGIERKATNHNNQAELEKKMRRKKSKQYFPNFLQVLFSSL